MTENQFNTVLIEHLSKNIAHIAIISYLDCKTPLRTGYELAVPRVQNRVNDLISLSSDTEPVAWSLKEFSEDLVQTTLDTYLNVKGDVHVSKNSNRFKVATAKIIELFKQLSNKNFVSQVPLKGCCSMLGCTCAVTVSVNNLSFCNTDFERLFSAKTS